MMDYSIRLKIISFSTLIFFLTNSGATTPVTHQKLYSNEELEAIRQFSPMVSKFLTMEFHKTEAYLLRYLRNENFDFKKAAQQLEKHHNWRLKNKIDSILDNDVAVISPNPRKYMPYGLDTHDKVGRPLLHLPFGRWNIRKYIIAGKSEIAQRHFQETFERTTRKLFREAATLSKDVDQLHVLVDLNGYNARENGCIACIPIMASFTRIGVAYGPFWRNVTVVNTPRIFNPVTSIVKSIVGDKLPIHFYDFDKAAWQEVLLKEISLDQLPSTMQ